MGPVRSKVGEAFNIPHSRANNGAPTAAVAKRASAAAVCRLATRDSKVLTKPSPIPSCGGAYIIETFEPERQPRNRPTALDERAVVQVRSAPWLL